MALKLAKQPDGSHRGTYRGHEVVALKVTITDAYQNSHSSCEARWGTKQVRDETRKGAVDRILHEIDMASINAPEIEALLQRWAGEIKAIVPLLNKGDLTA